MSKRSRARRSRARWWQVALVGVLALGVTAWMGARWLVGPVSRSGPAVYVAVPAGSGVRRVGARLQRLGLVRSGALFAWYAERTGYARRIKAGEYRLDPSMSSRAILERMARGGTDRPDVAVTIPEGFTLKQIAAALERKGITAARPFLQVVTAKRPALEAPFALPEVGLEGYLFPDTYRFLPGAAPREVAQAMLDTFVSRFYRPNVEALARSGRTLHEVVTIASMVEREARLQEDRPRIAGVIANRLRINMKLDIDATVQYARGMHKARLLYRDLKVDSPYNTYLHRGLPPGPIASPGLPSLEAALAPEQHPYLFYVARSDGRHVFTKTMAEHLRAVAAVRAQRRAGGSRG